MSSLKDLASLIMIPSLYKDGELHTVKPLADENIIVHPDATDNNDGIDGSTTPSTSSNFTFSRGSNLAATRVDVNGLIEKGRENLNIYSDPLDAQKGSTSYAAVTYEDNYNWNLGSLLNNAIVFVDNSTTRYAYYNNAVVSGTLYTLSVFMIMDDNSVPVPATDFLIVLGGVSIASGYSVEDYGNNVYRVSVYGISGASNTANGILKVASNSAKGFRISGFQVEQGLVATDYIETTGTTAQAGILEDMPRLDYSGGASCPSLLLEPQRTNITENSEYFNGTDWSKGNITIESNSIISPDGLLNASKLIENTANDRHSLTKSFSTSATNNTISAFFKKGTRRYASIVTSDTTYWNTMVVVDLEDGSITKEYNRSGITSTNSVEDYGNGWYRLIASINVAPIGSTLYARFTIQDSATPSNPPSNSYQGDGVSGIYIWGTQVELDASYPTSYIPTYGTTQTRSGDTSITSANTLGGLSVGTFFIEMERQGIDTSETGSAISLRDNAGAEELRLHFDAPASQVRWRDGNNSYAQIGNALPVTAGTAFKIIIKSDGTTAKVFGNGVQLGSDYSIVSAFDFQRIYNYQLGYEIKQQLFFPTALTDSECIALTTI